MTITKAKSRQAKHTGANALQAYIASLLYLREEARRDGLNDVAQILWDALAAVEAWMDSGTAAIASRDVLDTSLCHSLDFLLKWLALPLPRRRQVAHHIARYETEITTDEAVPRSPPRVSKRIAN